jgi:hypothetical protein
MAGLVEGDIHSGASDCLVHEAGTDEADTAGDDDTHVHGL